MEQPITFFSDPFNYTIIYNYEFDQQWLTIEIIHHKSFLTWFVNVDSEMLEKRDTMLNLAEDLNPKMLFDIFSKYQNKSLQGDVKVTLPLNYKSEEDDLSIGIVFIATTYGDKKIEDPRIICLKSKELSYEYRIDKKIETMVNQIHDEIIDLRTMADELKNTYAVSISNLQNQLNNMQVDIAKLQQT